MDLSIEDARNDVRATRRQISETADELSDRVHDRVSSAKDAVNPLEYARRYPWAALAIAAGVGLGVALTRAEKRAARAAVKGAKAAGGAIATGAVDLKDQAMDRVHGDDSEPSASNADAAAEPSLGSRIGDRIQSSVYELLSHGLDELVRGMRR